MEGPEAGLGLVEGHTQGRGGGALAAQGLWASGLRGQVVFGKPRELEAGIERPRDRLGPREETGIERGQKWVGKEKVVEKERH